MQTRNIQNDELVKIARAMLEGTYTEETLNEDAVATANACLSLAQETLGDGASKTYVKALAATYVMLITIGVPILVATIASGAKETAKDFIVDPIKGLWNKIRGNFSLKPDEIEQAANNAKALLKGAEKGKITRLANEMAAHIKNKDMGKAQETADEIYALIKK